MMKSNRKREIGTEKIIHRQGDELSSHVSGEVVVTEDAGRRLPLAISWFNWINFPVLFAKLWGALLIFLANDIYRMGFGDMAAHDWLPAPIYDAYNMTASAAQMFDWQPVMMWAFVANGLLYLLYILISGEWRYVLPNRRSLIEAAQILGYTFRLTKHQPPQRKFNGLQQVIYTAIIVICIGLVLTHLAMYYPYQVPWVNSMLGGYERARVQDFWLTAGYVLFFSFHVVQLVKSGRNNIKAVVMRPATQPPTHTEKES
jgi:thiosulfate reductase cytochrome b subunit